MNWATDAINVVPTMYAVYFVIFATHLCTYAMIRDLGKDAHAAPGTPTGGYCSRFWFAV